MYGSLFILFQGVIVCETFDKLHQHINVERKEQHETNTENDEMNHSLLQVCLISYRILFIITRSYTPNTCLHFLTIDLSNYTCLPSLHLLTLVYI